MTTTTTRTMRAIVIDAFGGLEKMKLGSLPIPEVGPNEVLIRVEVAGVGVWDPFEREGGFAKILGTHAEFPYVLGSDGAGTAAAVGEQVTRLKEGDKVYGLALANAKGGFYAEYAAINANDVSRIPDELSMQEAGALPVDAITALCGLDDTLGLTEGDAVMIFGASGGIGHLAVQLAKRMGARVFAVASGEDGVKMVERLGADYVVEGHRDDLLAAASNFAPAGFDAALMTAGGDAADTALSAMREGGRVAYPSGVEPEPKSSADFTVERYDGTPNPQIIDKLNRLVEAGPFEVHVAQAFPLEQAVEAHKMLEEHYLGKLVLQVT